MIGDINKGGYYDRNGNKYYYKIIGKERDTWTSLNADKTCLSTKNIVGYGLTSNNENIIYMFGGIDEWDYYDTECGNNNSQSRVNKLWSLEGMTYQYISEN